MVDSFVLLKLLINAAVHAHSYFNDESRPSIDVIIAQVDEDHWTVIGLKRYFPNINLVGSIGTLESVALEWVDFKNYQLHMHSVELRFSVCTQPDFIERSLSPTLLGMNRELFSVNASKVVKVKNTLPFSRDFEEANTLLLSLTSLLSHPSLPFLSHVNDMHFFPAISGMESASPKLSAGIHLCGEKQEMLLEMLEHLFVSSFGLVRTENTLGEAMEFNVRYFDDGLLLKFPASPGHGVIHRIPRVVMATLSNSDSMRCLKKELTDLMSETHSICPTPSRSTSL